MEEAHRVAPEQNRQPDTQPGVPGAKTVAARKKTSKAEWFRRYVAVMIAIVTLAGSLVAWRANLAGSDSGDLDSAGLLAVQNSEESNTLSYITADRHLISYIDYVRNLSLADATFYDYSDISKIPPEEYNQMVQWWDLATTAKRDEFFSGRYLGQDNYYDFFREVHELQAEDERAKDLHPEKSFLESDLLSSKVLGLLSMLVIMAVSLWLFALAETLSHPVKFVLAFGGTIFLILGSIGAFLIDTGRAGIDDTMSLSWTISLIAGGLLAVAAIALMAVVIVRGRRSTPVAATVQAGTVPGYTTTDPSNPVPVYTPSNAQPQPVQQQASPEKTEREEDEEDDDAGNRFKQVVTVLITTVALIASILAYVQSDASSRANNANRNVQQFSLNALGKNTYGAAEMSFHYGAAAWAWKQLDVLAKSADALNNPTMSARYRSARDDIAKYSTSNIFKKEYFDPDVQEVPDQYSFAADIYLTEATRLTERASEELIVNNSWSAKANAYITHLTLLAVALALFGLALAATSWTRYLFVGVGVALVIGTAAAATVTYSQGVKGINTDAIAAYADGRGLDYAAKYDDAIKKYDEALTIEPGYANALYWRGSARIAQKNYDDAIKDFEAAIAAGRADTNVYWSLGWSYYLVGKFDDAIRVDRIALQNDPTVVGMRLNLGLALLAQGKIDDANLEYNTAMARVSDQVAAARDAGKEVPSSLWYYLDAGVTDLDNLLYRMEDKEYYWTEAPPKETIVTPDDVYQEALDIIVRLKTRTVGFEYLGKPPEGQVTAEVTNFQFESVATASISSSIGYNFPYGTKQVGTFYDYKGLKKGDDILFKVYINSYEYPEYRQDITWDKDEEGSDSMYFADLLAVSNLYTLDSGQYIIEMYVNHHLVQRGAFNIDDPPAADTGTTP